jgi:hypothetical protein
MAPIRAVAGGRSSNDSRSTVEPPRRRVVNLGGVVRQGLQVEGSGHVWVLGLAERSGRRSSAEAEISAPTGEDGLLAPHGGLDGEVGVPGRVERQKGDGRAAISRSVSPT